MNQTTTITFETGYCFAGVKLNVYNDINEAIREAYLDGFKYIIQRRQVIVDGQKPKVKMCFIGFDGVKLLNFDQLLAEFVNNKILTEQLENRAQQDGIFIFCPEDNTFEGKDKRNFMSAKCFDSIRVMPDSELHAILGKLKRKNKKGK